jgi:hypothetical protein
MSVWSLYEGIKGILHGTSPPLHYIRGHPHPHSTHTLKEQLFTPFQDVVVVLASWELGRDAEVLEEYSEVWYYLVSLFCKTQVSHIFIFSNY